MGMFIYYRMLYRTAASRTKLSEYRMTVFSNKTRYLLVLPLLFVLLLELCTFSQPTLAGKDATKPNTSTQQNPYELPSTVIQRLKIDAGFGWGIFSGRIYNGNSDYTITHLIVSMEPVHDHHTADMAHHADNSSHQSRIHQIDMNLKPLTHGAISMALDDDVAHVHNFNWKVLQAFGYKPE